MVAVCAVGAGGFAMTGQLYFLGGVNCSLGSSIALAAADGLGKGVCNQLSIVFERSVYSLVGQPNREPI